MQVGLTNCSNINQTWMDTAEVGASFSHRGKFGDLCERSGLFQRQF